MSRLARIASTRWKGRAPSINTYIEYTPGTTNGNPLTSEGGGIDDGRSTVGVIEDIDLSIGGLCAGPGGKVFDREPVRGEKA